MTDLSQVHASQQATELKTSITVTVSTGAREGGLALFG